MTSSALSVQRARRAALLLAALLPPACARPDRPREDATASYRLVSVGGRPLPHASYSTVNGRPCTGGQRGGSYELSGARWVSADTLYERCADASGRDSVWVRRDSGAFSMRGDTIQFENPAPRPGEARVELLGLLRGDTLTAWGSGEEGGDHVYVRISREPLRLHWDGRHHRWALPGHGPRPLAGDHEVIRT